MARVWKPHSRIKLKLLKQYLQICADHHKKDNYKQFTFVDLFCGQPQIKFKDGKEEDGSPLIALKKNVKCVFNDISTEAIEMIFNLENKLQRNIIQVFNYDTNEKINEILDVVIPYYHSLIYLDPDKASQMSFNTVLSVINHTYKYKQTGEIRRPELLINFPINSIARNCGSFFKDGNDSIYEINMDFYGNNNWIEAYLSGNSASERRKNLLNTYIENFTEYYTHSYYILVESISSNSPQYYVIFFSNYGKIDDILPKLIKNINKWKKQDYLRKYKYNISYPIDYYNEKASSKIIKREISKNKALLE